MVSDPAPAASPEVAAAIMLPPVREIRDIDAARLKAVLFQLRLGLDATSRSLVSAHQVARQEVQRDERPQFDAAFVQVRMREVALRNSIAAASEAPPEKAAEAQAKVAADYEAYARALTVAHSLLQASRGALATANTPAAGFGNESLRRPAE